MDSHILLVVVAVLVVGAALTKALLDWQAGVARRKSLLAWAGKHGLTFRPDAQEELEGYFPGFPCLQRGSDRYGLNLIDGDWHGRRLLGFDYHYETGSGKDRKTHLFSGVILTSDVPLKSLLIRREGVGDKISAFFGHDDINFESAEFSREFFVSSSDRKWAYDVLHARTIQLLLASPRFAVQMDDRFVLAWRDERFEAADFEQAAELLEGILDGMPDYLLRQQAEVS